MLHGCPPSPDAWGRLNVVTPFHHLSGDSHINSSLREGPLAMLSARAALKAGVLLSRITRFSKLKRWGMDVAKRRGSKRAKVALARKIAVILHRMWVDGTTYRWTDARLTAPQV